MFESTRLELSNSKPVEVVAEVDKIATEIREEEEKARQEIESRKEQEAKRI